VTPAPLFRATQLKNRRLAGCGYTNEQNGLRQQSVPNVECIQDLLTGNYVQTVQLMGGIPHGFSGGPLQVCDGPYRYTAGILQLGGQGITTSQAIATDAIASFLIEAGWDGIIQDLPPATDAPTRPGLNDSAATVFNTTIGSISGGITNITNSVRSKT
jgi:hypothetical protein